MEGVMDVCAHQITGLVAIGICSSADQLPRRQPIIANQEEPSILRNHFIVEALFVLRASVARAEWAGKAG